MSTGHCPWSVCLPSLNMHIVSHTLSHSLWHFFLCRDILQLILLWPLYSKLTYPLALSQVWWIGSQLVLVCCLFIPIQSIKKKTKILTNPINVGSFWWKINKRHTQRVKPNWWIIRTNRWHLRISMRFRRIDWAQVNKIRSAKRTYSTVWCNSHSLSP